MNIEEKKKLIKDRFKDWGIFLMEEEESEFWDIIEQAINEACKEQREICVSVFKEAYNKRKDYPNQIALRILNSPSPLEDKK